MKIMNVNTKPERDPYVNIDGVSSYTELTFDPRDGTVTVSQEYQTNSWTMAEYHNLVRTCRIPNHSLEDDTRAEIESLAEQFDAVAAGFSEHWNGNNMVGRYTDAAESAWSTIEDQLQAFGEYSADSGYGYWEIGEWCQNEEISVDTTDAQIEEIATNCVDAAKSEHVILDGDRDDIVAWLKERRDELIQEVV